MEGEAHGRKGETGNPRTCIVTRATLPRERMIRFVAGPDGRVVADIANKLPGRGVWVTARAAIVETAVRNNRFEAGLKRKLDTPAALAAEVDQMLDRAALNALSIARKAGLVVTGFTRIAAAIQSRPVILLLHALDAAPDGVRKLAQAAHASATTGPGIAVKQLWPTSQMDLALGGHNVVHAAAIEGGAARALADRIEILEFFRT